MKNVITRLGYAFKSFSPLRKGNSTKNLFTLNNKNECLIETEELHSIIKSGKDYLLFDTSFYNIKSKQTEEIIEEYGNIGKINKTINFDSEIVKHENPNLCHLFPKKEEFFSYLKNLLISNDINIDSLDNIPIILYEKSEFFFAPRIWFVFKVFGFQNIRILNGGLNKWINEKREITNYSITDSNTYKNNFEKNDKIEEMINNHVKKNEKIIKNNLINNIYQYADIEKLIESKEKKEMNNYIILDPRPNEVYTAMIEIQQKDKNNEIEKKKVPNYIPFSINIPYTKFLNFSDQFTNNKEKENQLIYVTLKNVPELYNTVYTYNLLKGEKVIVAVCNKGITASIALFILYLLNKPFSNLILYPGSMTEYKMIKYKL